MHCHIEATPTGLVWLIDSSDLVMPPERARYKDVYSPKLAEWLMLADGFGYKDHAIPPVQLSTDIAHEIRLLMLKPQFPQCSEAPTIRIPSSLAMDLRLPHKPILISQFLEHVQNMIDETKPKPQADLLYQNP